LEGGEAEVEPVIVTSNSRGDGIGRALLEHVKDEVRKLGVSMLSIRPVARNAGAISLFHDFGFRTLGHIDMFMELSPDSERVWKSGLTLHGHEFRH
jgi:GNAT superfamily N-acetyltransferase